MGVYLELWRVTVKVSVVGVPTSTIEALKTISSLKWEFNCSLDQSLEGMQMTEMRGRASKASQGHNAFGG